jgi:hypothetical protein
MIWLAERIAELVVIIIDSQILFRRSAALVAVSGLGAHGCGFRSDRWLAHTRRACSAGRFIHTDRMDCGVLGLAKTTDVPNCAVTVSAPEPPGT